MEKKFKNKGAEVTYTLRKNKTYAEIYGSADRAEQIKEKQRNARKKQLKQNPGMMKGENHPFYGRHHSEGSKKLIGSGMKGKLVGEKNPMKREENKEKIRIARRKYFVENPEALSGERNPAWQGGNSFKPYGVEFNEALKLFIRQRDKFTCQFCGIGENGRKHDVHHIDYNKQNNQLENFVTLCFSCHPKTQFNREKWQFCFQVLQEIKRNKI